jgi:hypothetical protein
MPTELKKEVISFRDFIGYEKDVFIHLHNTFSENTAIAILNEGFKFVKSLDYTTDHVTNSSEEEINYFILKRKYYGKFTIVIQIGIEISKYYTTLNKDKEKVLKELVFSKRSDEKNEDDLNYNFLNRQFIKGYYIHETGHGVYNPSFDPHKKLSDFHDNLNNIEP